MTPVAAAPDAARTRLVCLPYAGGTPSAYRGWDGHLGDRVRVVPVLLPGRGLRLHEAPYTRMVPLAADLATALTAHGITGRPGGYALFGHSMGALLAYEVACVLRERGEPGPRHLFVSGSRAPHLYGDRADHALADDGLRRFVRDLGGLGGTDPGGVGGAYLERRLPVLRADLTVCDTYRWRPRGPLGCPMTAFSASDDPLAGPGEVEAWRAYTTGSFLRRHLPGGHFFLLREAPRLRLLRELRSETDRFGPGPGSGPESPPEPPAAFAPPTASRATPPTPPHATPQRNPSWTY
ncbi:alpha/beta fold hydrolase [Streptomyces sp. TRM 70361]|uniref:thioesterase II family protein n=1 Tax=Streptomyces sp. TRM 70361 TaxID=3116553 RepID=UPI002E7B3384|nr:alpha/beta fold hydrolase [Streptomyces sp. TRM 70361]MEE1942547.1 alpha/beta fold hydrolase [Streptomyces sp. TRM 70361]